MKIYTKTGDEGTTGLIGKRVSKSHIRIEIIGLLDEVMVLLGQLISALDKEVFDLDELRLIYQNFFKIQTMIADINNEYQFNITNQAIEHLEQQIDRLTKPLPPLKNFIYYTGHEWASLAQLVRTKIRTVERSMIALHEVEPIDSNLLVYINRASDYFYTLGRYINCVLEIDEEIITFI